MIEVRHLTKRYGTHTAISFIYLIAVPIISMRVLAEEKRQKTDQLLYSLPMRLSSVVIGKYLGMVTALAVPVLFLTLYPLILSQYGEIRYASAYSALFAFFLLGACLLSVGLFISSVTESQVAAAVITLVAMLLLYFMNGLSSFCSSAKRTAAWTRPAAQQRGKRWRQRPTSSNKGLRIMA